MLKLLKQYKFVILTLLVCLMGLGSLLYEKQQSQEFLLETNIPVVTTANNINTDDLMGQTSMPIIAGVDLEGQLIADGPSTSQVVPIYICGEVKYPGVYYMQEEALINEAIQMSGGFTTGANTQYLNLASPIQAHGKIVVPKQGEEIDKSLNSYDNKESSIVQVNNGVKALEMSTSYININTASVEELMVLPGIGEKKAQAIKAYREQNGGFKESGELTEVDGIGDKTFEKIQTLIIVQ